MGRRREAFPKPDETTGLIGQNFRGRVYIDTRLPYVDFDPDTQILTLDTEATDDYDPRVTYDPDTGKVTISDEG